uniref:m7GpppX diphosphatase n=1 Tax=Ciona savignyi TaxID=51511 RepID=H2ZLJ5_CIOSA
MNDSQDCSASNAKRIKIGDNEVNEKITTGTVNRSTLSGIGLVSVLNDNSSRKVACLHGKVASDGNDGQLCDAVIILEKKPFDQNNLQQLLSKKTKLTVDLQNDIYSTFTAFPPPELSDIKATIICPATEKHIRKYTKQKSFIVQETASDYQNITLPYLEKQIAANVFNIQWVFNILEHKVESERIIYEDPDKENGFILLPDMKWDRVDKTALYVIAIPHKRGLRSLRDLSAEHIPLLENILTKGLAVIEEKFGLKSSELRVYFHYQPSYYHLHIHFNNVELDMPGTGALRAHLLADVIENLTLSGNYYRNKTFTFELRENDNLYLEFQRCGKV